MRKRYPGQFYDEASPAMRALFLIGMCIYLGGALLVVLLGLISH